MLRFPQRRPLRNVRVNWSHPLAKGLLGWWNFDEAGGVNAIDVTQGRVLAWQSPGFPDWIATPYGAGVKGANANTQTMANTDLVIPTGDTTIICIATVPSSGNNGLFCSNGTNGSTDTCGAFLPFSGTNYFDFGGNSGSNRVSYTPTSTGDWRHIAYTAGSSGMAIYEDGVSKVSSGTAVTRTNTAGSGINLFAYPVNPSASNAGGSHIALFAIWSRILSAGEINWHRADPYAIFTMPWAYSGAGAGGSFNPAWARGNQVIAGGIYVS